VQIAKVWSLRGLTSDFFHSYLSNRCQFTKFGQTESSHINITCGSPQGLILGPLLVLLYMNDLPQASAFQTVLFADDTCLFFKSNCMSTLQAAVNGEIKHVDDWLISNKLTLNCSKTKFMVPTKSHKLQKFKINVVAGAVEEVNQVKYLGVLTDIQLKWQQQLDHVCKELACASYTLLKLRAFSPISTLKTVYYALVHPHLSCGLACWSNATKTSLKKIIILQNKIFQLMTYSEQQTPASGLCKSPKF